MTEIDTIVEKSTAQTFVDALTVVDVECKLHAEDNGFRVSMVDPGNIFMAEAMLGASSFEHYDVDADDPLGVNLQRFDEALGFADAGDPIRVGKVEQSGVDRLDVETTGITHEIALIDVESIRQEPDVPAVDLPVEVTLEGRQLKRAVKAADTVSEHCTFIWDPERDVFVVSSAGDTDNIDVEYSGDDLVDFDADGGAESIFSVGYLLDLVKPIPASSEVTLWVGTEFPLKAKWKFSEEAGVVSYYLAPRLDT